MRHLLVLLLAGGVALACGDSGGGAQGGGDASTASDALASDVELDGEAGEEDDADVFGGPDRSTYTMRIVLYDESEVADLERDVTDQPQAFSYGSAHIGSAVAFAVTETMFWPSHVTVTFDFGKVVGMPPEFPIQTSGTGEYPFSDSPPALEVFVEGLQYKSLFDGADGHITLTEWGPNVGDTIAGHYAGRLIQDTDKPLDQKLWLDVDGEFHFVIPEKQDF